MAPGAGAFAGGGAGATEDEPTVLVGRESAGDWMGGAAVVAAGAWSGEDATGVVTLACAVTSDPAAWELLVRESGAAGRAKFEVLAEGDVFNPKFAMAVFNPET